MQPARAGWNRTTSKCLRRQRVPATQSGAAHQTLESPANGSQEPQTYSSHGLPPPIAQANPSQRSRWSGTWCLILPFLMSPKKCVTSVYAGLTGPYCCGSRSTVHDFVCNGHFWLLEPPSNVYGRKDTIFAFVKCFPGYRYVLGAELIIYRNPRVDVQMLANVEAVASARS